jgi:hypothetical protein
MGAIARRTVFLICAAAFAQTPGDVVQFLRGTATELADAHENGPRGFLDRFDRAMPEYAAFRGNIEALTGRAEVGSAIEIVSDSGDQQRRVLELDWVLEIQDQAPRRQVVKCTIEKRGKTWKFTAVEPIDFFKY